MKTTINLLIGVIIFINSMSGQSLRDIERLIQIENDYGFELPKHAAEISNSVYEITGIEKSGEYLNIEDLTKVFGEKSREELDSLFDILNFPLAIHSIETYRKKLNAKWVFIGHGKFWVPYLEIKNELIHPETIYDLYLNNYLEVIPKTSIELTKYDAIDAIQSIKKLSEFLQIPFEKLNFSEESLLLIDKTVNEHKSVTNNKTFYDNMVIYVGETFIKKYGGEWMVRIVKGKPMKLIEFEEKKFFKISLVVDFGLYDDEYLPYLSAAFQNETPISLKEKTN